MKIVVTNGHDCGSAKWIIVLLLHIKIGALHVRTALCILL